MDWGYTLGSPRRGGSNEYPQSMFWSKNKKNVFTPVYPSLVYKSGVEGGIHFPDGAIMIEMISSSLGRSKVTMLQARIRNQKILRIEKSIIDIMFIQAFLIVR